MDATNTEADSRQSDHQKRSRRARRAAKLLFPVCALMISTALWSEPKIAGHLERGLIAFSDLIRAEKAARQPEADSPAIVRQSNEDDQNRPAVRAMPTDKVRVNRP